MRKYKQRGIYFSHDLDCKMNLWIGLHPHVSRSHLIREALFEYFQKHKDKLNVDFNDRILPSEHSPQQ